MANFYNPRIVTNGLRYYFDVSNPRSYPGTGGDIFNIAPGALNTDTLFFVNSPIFDSSLNIILTNETPSRRLQTTSVMNFSNSTIIINGRVRSNTLNSVNNIFQCNFGGNRYNIFVIGNDFYIGRNDAQETWGQQQFFIFNTSQIGFNFFNFFSLCIRYNGTTFTLIYNGRIIQSFTPSVPYHFTGGIIDLAFGRFSQSANLDINSFLVYDRVLSNSDINQNTNIFRNRLRLPN